jgi:small basic protein (TIGR04137 family)
VEIAMSLDPSLRITKNTSGKRSVMTRVERIAKMVNDKKLDPKKDMVLGLPKTLLPKV